MWVTVACVLVAAVSVCEAQVGALSPNDFLYLLQFRSLFTGEVTGTCVNGATGASS
jgi:hypothetical protein